MAMHSPGSAVSSLTESPPGAKTAYGKKNKNVPAHPMPKSDKKRRPTMVLQQDRVAEKMKRDHEKKAQKRATTLYAAEKEKKNGVSANEVQGVVKGGPGLHTVGDQRLQ